MGAIPKKFFKEKAKANQVRTEENRVCQVPDKQKIEFKTIEQDFASRSAVLMWIMDNQLARRNINLITRKYLTGRRYKEEKKAVGGYDYVRSGGSNFPPIKTAERIGAQVGMSDRVIAHYPLFSFSFFPSPL